MHIDDSMEFVAIAGVCRHERCQFLRIFVCSDLPVRVVVTCLHMNASTEMLAIAGVYPLEQFQFLPPK